MRNKLSIDEVTMFFFYSYITFIKECITFQFLVPSVIMSRMSLLCCERPSNVNQLTFETISHPRMARNRSAGAVEFSKLKSNQGKIKWNKKIESNFDFSIR